MAFQSDDKIRNAWADLEFRELTKLINTPEILSCSDSDLKQNYLKAEINVIREEVFSLTLELWNYQKQVLTKANGKKPASGLLNMSVWPNTVKDELVKSLSHYSTEMKIQIKPEYVLKVIASRLLQTDTYQTEAEENKAEAEFSNLLEGAIGDFIKETNPNKQQFRQTITEGVLMLGANPVTWMNNALNGKITLFNQSGVGIAKNIAMTSRNSLEVGLLFGKLSDIIISQLLSRSKFLGDSSIYLQSELTKVVSAINLFILALQHSVDGKYWFLKLLDLVKMPFSDETRLYMSAVNSEHRDERIFLYLSVMKLVYVILNHSIKEVTHSHARALQFKSAKDQFYRNKETCEKNISDYSWKGWVLSFVANLGRSGYKELVNLLQAIEELLEATKKIAINRETLINIQKQDAVSAISGQRREVAEESSREDQAETAKIKMDRESINTVILNAIKNTLHCSLSSQGIDNTLDGISCRKKALFIEVRAIFSDVAQEQLEVCIDECVDIYLSQRTATGQIHPDSFFAQAAAPSNPAVPQPAAESASSSLGGSR